MNVDEHNYELDQEEPMPCKIDSSSDPKCQKMDNFDVENLVDTTFVQLPTNLKDKLIE